MTEGTPDPLHQLLDASIHMLNKSTEQMHSTFLCWHTFTLAFAQPISHTLTLPRHPHKPITKEDGDRNDSQLGPCDKDWQVR